jgi:diguanylate cyclase
MNDIARNTLESLKKYNLEPTPHNFSVWYAYHVGKNDALNRRMDTFINVGIDITDKVMDGLFRNYIMNSMLDDLSGIRTVASNIEDTTSALVKRVADFSTTIEDHRKTVNKMSSDINKVETEKSFSALLEDLYSELNSIHSASQHTYLHLESDLKQINTNSDRLRQFEKNLYIDYLTGLPNRDKFLLDIQDKLKVLNSGAVSGLNLCVVCIDNISEYNTDFGWLIGDSIIRRVVKELAVEFSTIYRYNGNKFVIIPADDSMRYDLTLSLDKVFKLISGLKLTTSDKKQLPQIKMCYDCFEYTVCDDVGTICSNIDTKTKI